MRRHRDDDQVVSTLANLPLPQDSHWDLPQRVGVANEEGEIYRYIVVSSAFELLQLTAKLNAKGFSVSAELRLTRVGHYERIFTKVHPISQVTRDGLAGAADVFPVIAREPLALNPVAISRLSPVTSGTHVRVSDTHSIIIAACKTTARHSQRGIWFS